MATTKTVATRSAHTVGAGTVLGHAPSVTPLYGYSLHDCASPELAGVHNMIWPIGGTAGNLTFKQGLVVHHRDGSTSGTVTVTTA